MTPRKYSEETLARAKNLVETTDWPMADIADTVGMKRTAIWWYVHRGEWKHDWVKRKSNRGLSIPDDLPYWRFRIYRKLIGVTKHEEALRLALAAPVPAYMVKEAA